MISPLRPSNFRTSEACSSNSRSRLSGFTLLELILVIAIIAVLASLLIPAIGTAQQHAYSVSCSSNLRAIGVATQCYLQDHGFLFPCIEPLPDSSSNVYPANFQPTPYTCMGGTNGAFGPYGITQQMTQCPTDYKSPNHGSYGANPLFMVVACNSGPRRRALLAPSSSSSPRCAWSSTTHRFILAVQMPSTQMATSSTIRQAPLQSGTAWKFLIESRL